ncbi:MAG: hydroxymethylbilane synthase [Phycisphaerales bacterium]|nr:MAG: hydroxymethylbilane synthase [Phycisphaerales bacterium]
MRTLKIASRASKLALAQSNFVAGMLEKLGAGVRISILKVSTKGDRDKSDFLYKADAVGLFTSEVENAVIDGRADLAVHSLKDLPTALTDGLTVAAIPKRESVEDALVASGAHASISDLPPGATVGTSSVRRIAQLRRLRPDLQCVPLRGNVETRLSKVASGEVDAAVLACAGLSRLDLADRISAVLSPLEFLPAPAQGALAVQVRTDDTESVEFVAQLDHRESRIRAEAERRILASMHGGCSIPLGVYSSINQDIIALDAVVCDLAGARYIRLSKSSHIDNVTTCAEELARELLAAGAQDILDQIRKDRAG